MLLDVFVRLLVCCALGSPSPPRVVRELLFCALFFSSHLMRSCACACICLRYLDSGIYRKR